MNRTSVLACIQSHLQSARKESGGVRPLGELIPQIAAELRAGSDTSGIQAGITPVTLVAAFIDGLVSPQEEFAVCQSILVDNSVLAELVAGVLALEEVHQEAEPLPPLSTDLTARLFELTSQAFSNAVVEPIEAQEQIIAPEFANEQALTLTTIRKPIRSHSRTKWQQPVIATFAVVACLLLIVWWTFNQATRKIGSDGVVRVPSQPEVRKPLDPSQGNRQQSPPREEGLAVQAPNDRPAVPSRGPNELSPLETPAEMPQVVVTPPAPSVAKPETFTATPIKSLQWKKISGLLAQRALNSDYADDSGWRGLRAGSDDEGPIAIDATQLLTLPMSRAEAEIASGGKLVLAADTRLSFAQGGQPTSAKVALSYGLIAFIDMPQNTAIEFTDNDRTTAVIKWGGTKSTLIVTVTDVGLQAQVTGGEVSINQQSVRNSVVSIDAQSVNELKDRNTRLPAWVSRPVESIPVSKVILGQLAGADNLAETLDRLLEASASAGEADNGRSLLSNWRASLSDSNLLRTGESRSPLVRLQALQRLVALPDWDLRYKHSWQRFATATDNEADLLFLRQTFELVRRGGKLNMVQIAQLVKLLESPQFAVRSLSDFILRSNFGGGPQFDPNPQAYTRGIGLWRRYISSLRNNVR